MPSFKCDACGLPYTDSHNFATCPHCGGLGRPKKGCTCIYWTSWGQRLFVHTYKLDCPVHIKETLVERILLILDPTKATTEVKA